MNARDKALAEQAGLDLIHGKFMTASQEKFANLIRADEREACAKVCDDQHDRARTSAGAARADSCAAVIRARNNK